MHLMAWKTQYIMLPTGSVHSNSYTWQILFEIRFFTCKLHNIHTACLF
jgi:hypothetical protein